jgi:hypothetical protein
MKVLIEISPEHYASFLEKCDTDFREYSLLKNGVVLRREVDGTERRMIAILCEQFQAYILLFAARALYFPAVEDINRSLDPLYER